VQHVPNAQLALAIVPRPEATIEEIAEFASSFNGYTYWGSFEGCAEIANGERHDSLTNVRTCLFFEVRRWHHFGDGPDAEAQEQWRGLVRHIRRFVEEGRFE
jgi:hypothetical protein